MEEQPEILQESARVKAPGTFWNADKWLSISAFLISLGTFLVLIYQTHLSREQAILTRQQALLEQKQQYASVLPYLQIMNQYPDSRTYKLLLVNNGIGPAFIRQISVHYKGKIYKVSPHEFLYNMVPAQERPDFHYTGIFPGRLIPAGEKIEVVGSSNSEEDAQKLMKLFGLREAQIEIVFGSVYEETWQVKGISTAPVKVK